MGGDQINPAGFPDALPFVLERHEEKRPTAIAPRPSPFRMSRNPIVPARATAVGDVGVFWRAPVAFGALDGPAGATLFTLISPTVKAHLHFAVAPGVRLAQSDFKALIVRQASRDEILAAVKKISDGLRASPANAKKEAAGDIAVVSDGRAAVRRGGCVVADESSGLNFSWLGAFFGCGGGNCRLRSRGSGVVGRRGPAIAIALAGAVRRIFH